MIRLILLITSCVLYVVSFSQKTGSIRGRVTNKQSGEPLSGATVAVKEGSALVFTDRDGYFAVANLTVDRVTLLISHVGYENIEIAVTVAENSTTFADAGLSQDTRIASEVVVTASRRPEKIVNAPASVHVIGKKNLEQFSGSNVFELFSRIQGIEFVRTGVDYIAINARGFNRAANNKVFQIVDGRNAMGTVSTGLPLYNNWSVNKDDIEKIEIVLGPQAALYGPNVHNALFYTTTKDPRKYQGTTVSASAGNRYQFSARLRHAAKINSKWAYKLTGEYVAGKDFVFYDSVRITNRPVINSDPIFAVPERNVDFDARHIRGESHVYYSITSKTDIILSGGISKNQFLGVTNTGRNQMRGVKTGFVQARIVHPNYFVNVYNAWGDIGTSYGIAPYTRDYWLSTHRPVNPLPPDSAELYALRSGNTFREQNQRFNAEGQYNYLFQNAGLFLVTGLSYQKERPETFGYSLVDRERRIYITQTGAVVQLEKTLPWTMRLIGAARWDHHSTMGNFFSPKLALTKTFDEGSVRITWARAYSMPSVFYQYANLNGLTFGNGPGIAYIPNGVNVSDAPVRTIPLKAEEISTWEIGYKGTFGKKLYVDINGYYGQSKNFLGPPLPVDGRAVAVGDIAVQPADTGWVDQDGVLHEASFNTFFNYGNVTGYGVDIGANYSFNKTISVDLVYSWFGSDITKDNLENDANHDGSVTAEEKSKNAPGNRIVATLGFQNLWKQRVFVNVSARFTGQYDFYSGNQIGTAAGKGDWGVVPRPPLPPLSKNFDWGALGGFTVFDLSAGYKVNEMVNVNLGITNVFNAKQLEFVGSPYIGRLILAEIRVHVPDIKKK